MNETNLDKTINDLVTHILERHDSHVTHALDLLDTPEESYILMLALASSHVSSFAATLAHYDKGVRKLDPHQQVAVALTLIIRALGMRPPRTPQEMSDVAAAVHPYPNIELLDERRH